MVLVSLKTDSPSFKPCNAPRATSDGLGKFSILPKTECNGFATPADLTALAISVLDVGADKPTEAATTDISDSDNVKANRTLTFTRGSREVKTLSKLLIDIQRSVIANPHRDGHPLCMSGHRPRMGRHPLRMSRHPPQMGRHLLHNMGRRLPQMGRGTFRRAFYQHRLNIVQERQVYAGKLCTVFQQLEETMARVTQSGLQDGRRIFCWTEQARIVVKGPRGPPFMAETAVMGWPERATREVWTPDTKIDADMSNKRQQRGDGRDCNDGRKQERAMSWQSVMVLVLFGNTESASKKREDSNFGGASARLGLIRTHYQDSGHFHGA
ncbi:hypothetical protein B0H10DRAFT_1951291 [Mycena sp. CBHHK59/15]|nr:hypothetical protein B0H10DRAFT_1951291 [Mycena sp. CBHHK59/15]